MTPTCATGRVRAPAAKARDHTGRVTGSLALQIRPGQGVVPRDITSLRMTLTRGREAGYHTVTTATRFLVLLGHNYTVMI